MCRLLKPKYYKAVQDDEHGLFRKVGAALGVKPLAFLKLMTRTPDRLAHYDAVTVIANTFHVTPEDILTFGETKVYEDEDAEYSADKALQ